MLCGRHAKPQSALPSCRIAPFTPWQVPPMLRHSPALYSQSKNSLALSFHVPTSPAPPSTKCTTHIKLRHPFQDSPKFPCKIPEPYDNPNKRIATQNPYVF